MKPFSKTLPLFSILYAPLALYASDSLTVKTISMDLAREVAIESVIACRKKGYQVSDWSLPNNGFTSL